MELSVDRGTEQNDAKSLGCSSVALSREAGHQEILLEINPNFRFAAPPLVHLSSYQISPPAILQSSLTQNRTIACHQYIKGLFSELYGFLSEI